MPSDNVTASVAVTTAVTSGVANWFDLINDWLGLVAVLMGITLTGILIAKHWKEYRALDDG